MGTEYQELMREMGKGKIVSLRKYGKVFITDYDKEGVTAKIIFNRFTQTPEKRFLENTSNLMQTEISISKTNTGDYGLSEFLSRRIQVKEPQKSKFEKMLN